MRKALILLVFIVSFASCGSARKAQVLYYWGGESDGTTRYERLAYNNFHRETPQSVCDLVVLYEDLVKHPGGLCNKPAPGICAEYGYLLLIPETASAFTEYATSEQKAIFSSGDFVTYFRQYGLELLQMEMEYYPEATTFIMPLLKKFSSR